MPGSKIAVALFTTIGVVYKPGWKSMHPPLSGQFGPGGTLLPLSPFVGDSGGTAGAGTFANGSLMGAAVDHVPVVPGRNPDGAVLGRPVTPKALPVKFGPPFLKSIVGPVELHCPPALLVAAAQLALLELT